MITLDTNLSAKNATTQYLNFDYDSMVKFENKFLCAAGSGLFEMTENTDDDGDHIESYFEPITMDFGIASEKRLRSVYIGYEAAGDLTLTISTELGFSQSYVVPENMPGQHGKKVVISRSLRGRYWTFQIYGSGVSFSIDKITILPILRGHGFERN